MNSIDTIFIAFLSLHHKRRMASAPADPNPQRGELKAVETASLTAFFVFNPTLGDEDTEGHKILFFYPQLDINTQKDYVGIAEALNGFTR